MLKTFKALLGITRLEEELSRERVAKERLEAEHRRQIVELKSDHIDHVSDIESVYQREVARLESQLEMAKEFQTRTESLLTRQIEVIDKERKSMQDSFLRINGVNPVYEQPSRLEPQYYENQPDDSGPVGARILNRSAAEQEEFLTQEEAAFQRWQLEKLGMASDSRQAVKIGDEPDD